MAIPVSKVPVTLSSPYTNFKVSTFNDSINSNWNLSVFSVCVVLTVAPPQAFVSLVDAVLLFFNPSVETNPKFLKASFNSAFASFGTGVPSGATNTAPPTLGFAEVTFLASFFLYAIYILPFITNNV